MIIRAELADESSGACLSHLVDLDKMRTVAEVNGTVALIDKLESFTRVNDIGTILGDTWTYVRNMSQGRLCWETFLSGTG